jgi:hypothetical protein
MLQVGGLDEVDRAIEVAQTHTDAGPHDGMIVHDQYFHRSSVLVGVC